MAFLEQYPWPGNVRQLENLMERLVITAQNPILDITALPLEYNSGGSAPDLPSQEGTLAERMDAFEGQIIRDSYRRCRHHGGCGEGTGHLSGHRCPENRQICEGPEGMKLL